MEWKLQVLGSNSAVPTPGRYPSAQVLDTENELYLIDCGECTQVRMSEFKVRRSRINHIFISHLHGDHIFGLPGLITSYNLYERQNPLTIYGPKGLESFLKGIISSTEIRLHFELIIKEHNADQEQTIYDAMHCRIQTIPLSHRIPTTGYLFTEMVSSRRLDPVAVERWDIPRHAYADLQEGKDYYLEDGTLLDNSLLTKPGRRPLQFAYCTDTVYLPSISKTVRGVDLLYHEATFLHELKDHAARRGHSTASQAARIARDAEVGQLILGHFSSRYKQLDVFMAEAQRVFANTIIAEEGKIYPIRSDSG